MSVSDENHPSKLQLQQHSMISNDPPEIVSWLICRVDSRNRVYNLVYGQFAKQDSPPRTGWVFLGRPSGGIESRSRESNSVFSSQAHTTSSDNLASASFGEDETHVSFLGTYSLFPSHLCNETRFI